MSSPIESKSPGVLVTAQLACADVSQATKLEPHVTTPVLPKCTLAQFPIKSNSLFSSLGFGELGFDIFIGCYFDSSHLKKQKKHHMI